MRSARRLPLAPIPYTTSESVILGCRGNRKRTTAADKGGSDRAPQNISCMCEIDKESARVSLQ